MLWRTDQGSEYTAGAFRKVCERCGVSQSMGRPGSGLENAVIESWHSTLEFELRALEHFATKTQARQAVTDWIEDYTRIGSIHRSGCALRCNTSNCCATTNPGTRHAGPSDAKHGGARSRPPTGVIRRQNLLQTKSARFQGKLTKTVGPTSHLQRHQSINKI